MTDPEIMFLQDKVDAARDRWARALSHGTEEQERATYEKVRRLENQLREAVIKQEETL